MYKIIYILSVTIVNEKPCGLHRINRKRHNTEVYIGYRVSIDLFQAASHYENVAVRRLGCLLELFGYDRQAEALVSQVRKAKSFKLLDPSIKTLVTALPIEHE